MDRERTKQELSGDAWKKIRKIIEKKRISQVELSRLCEAHGYHVPQPEISKLYSGKIPLTLYHAAAFAQVLDFSLDWLIFQKAGSKVYNLNSSAFVTNPENEAFEGCLGTFYTVFQSTTPFEKNVLFGKLTFSTDPYSRVCNAHFELNTGEKDEKGEPIKKFYDGQLVISTKLGVGFCTLINERIGEITNLEFRYRSFLVKQMECRLGMVLTVSSGEVKTPTVQKMLLTRTPVETDALDVLMPFLKLESEDILVNKSILKEITEKYQKGKRYQSFDFNEFYQLADSDEYVIVNEGVLRKVKKRLNRKEMAELFSILKKESAGSFLVSLNEKDDSLTYELFRESRETDDMC